MAPALAAMSYLYDANGNMTSDGTKCYEYNDANQLKKVKKCSDSKIIAEYIYDHTGKRIIKKEYKNGVLERTVYSIGDEYETVVLASNGAKLNTTYYKVNDEVVAKKNPDGAVNYYHNDHLGSNSVLTDQSGAVVEKTTYQPYGEVKSGGTKSKFGYTGQEKDSETGLNYYDARYYDPHLQRFVQPDTMLPDVYDPQQLNRYSYARNNPLTYNDPTGHCIGFLSPFCGAIMSVVTKVIQPVVSLIARIQNNPIAQRVEQNLSKVQSNPVVQKTENTPGRLGNNPVVQKTTSNVDKITKTFNVPSKALDIAQKIKDDAGQPIKGYMSKPFENREGLLPKAGKYIEHDIKPLLEGVNRGKERLIIDINNGRTWYTSTHYESFVEIK